MDDVQVRVEIIERLARIEENQTFLKQIYSEDKKEREEILIKLTSRVKELETFKDSINQKIAYIGGVLVMIGLIVPYTLKWIYDHLSFKL